MKTRTHLKKWGKIAALHFAIFLSVAHANAQAVGSGSIEARFGIDADLYADTAIFGTANTTPGKGKNSDDWFKKNLSGTGIGVIDTNGAWYYKKLLSNSAASRDTLSFSMPMSVPKLTRSGGYIMLDALYARDYFNNDRTIITSGSKAVDDPSTWTIGSGSVQSKDEIMEFYSHVRRKGTTVKDSLFFYFAVGVHGTTGNKNVAAEMFVNNVQLNQSTGKLTNLGSDGGRVAWQFDAQGKVTKVGDMVISMSYQPGGAGFTIEPRIWVHDTSRKTATGSVTPVNFDWGAKFDKQNSTGFGFADIKPIGGNTFAQGTANSADTSAAAPWGTIESGSAHNWQSFYDANQFVEVSVNLTALGVDPGFFDNIDPCAVPYRTLVFRSRASVSFNSDLADIAGPYPFWRYPRVNALISGIDTLTCRKTTGSIFADSAYSLAYYNWTAINGGNIVSQSADHTSITFDKPGKYILECAPIQGCYTLKDTVQILQDAAYPVATAAAYDTLILGSVYAVKLYGGDSAASVANTSANGFGPSKGIQFSWTGPSGFQSQMMQPFVNSMGRYFLTATELRNGCTDTASTYLALLPMENYKLECEQLNSVINLNWNGIFPTETKGFEVYRINSRTTSKLGYINLNSITGDAYQYRDLTPGKGFNQYVVYGVNSDGMKLFQMTCGKSILGSEVPLKIFPNPATSQIQIEGLNSGYPFEYRIRNYCGALVQKGISDSDIKIDPLNSGVYFIEIISGEIHEKLRFEIIE